MVKPDFGLHRINAEHKNLQTIAHVPNPGFLINNAKQLCIS